MKNPPRYKIRESGKRGTSISHLLFIDDLKTYASDKKGSKITAWFEITVFKIYQSVCNLEVNTERGNQKSLRKFLNLDETKLVELTEGECYDYLGQDEKIGCNDVLNKERVTKEYTKRICKI